MNPNIKTLKLKIFAIFLIPTMLIVYFTFYYVKSTNAHIHTIQQQTTNIETIKKLMDLVRSLQIERGLSAGYIVAKDNFNREKLLAAYAQTDENLQHLKKFQSHLKTFLQAIPEFRQKLLNKKVNFNEEIEFYTHIINDTISLIRFLLPQIDTFRYDTLFVENLELMKENAGLERACVYNQLILGTTDITCKNKVKELQLKQAEQEKNLLLYGTQQSLELYNRYLQKENIQELQRLRELYLAQKLHTTDASHWFKVTTQRIDNLNKVSKEILNRCIEKIETQYNETISNLNWAIVLWIISILAGIYFVYLIEKLFKKHEEYTQELELASHTMDSYEGIIITKPDTTIIKVNNGFERITGYTPKDAIGEKTNMLKSGKHNDAFYQKMWDSINTTGSWSGEIFNKRKDGKIYAQRLSVSTVYDSKGNVKNYVGHIFDISKLKKAQEEALYQASHDFLTELINRKYLIERLKEELNRAKRHNFIHAFLFIDLDNFKAVNDNYGHHIGDKLLKYVAKKIKSCVREDDIVARISGDEFGVVLLNLEKSQTEDIESIIQVIAEKILNALNNEILIDNNIIRISCSIGVKTFPTNELCDEEQIIKAADKAMYMAKNQGKNNFVIY